MTFGESVRVCLHKYVDFEGRASRAEYWWFTLFLVLVVAIPATIGAIVMVLGMPMSQGAPVNGGLLALGGTVIGLSFLASFALLLPSLAVSARRLRDAGFSAWLLLLTLVPFGNLALFVMWLLPSKPVTTAPATIG